MNSVCQMGVKNANARTVHKFLKNSNDTDMTQPQFISQIVIQDETWLHSESKQQSMQWNKQIGQNFSFRTLQYCIFCNSVFPFPFRLQITASVDDDH